MFLKPLLLLSVSCLSLFVSLGLSSPINHLSICKELVFTAAVEPLDSPPSPSLLYVAWRGYSKEKESKIEPDSPQLRALPCNLRLSYNTSGQMMALTRNEPKDEEMRRSYPAYLLHNETLLFLLVADPPTAYQVIQSLQTGNVLTYYCGHNNLETSCYQLKVKGKTLSRKRSLEDSGIGPESHAHAQSKTWALPVFGLMVGVVLLTVSVFMCVKSSSQNEQLLQPNSTGTLRILSGPPPEYFGPPPVPVTSRPHSTTLSNPDSLSRGGGGGKPTSPSALSNGDKDRSFSLPSSPGHQSPRRKLATPLPDVPKQEVKPQEGLEQKPVEKEPERKEEEEEEEQEEDPYDYAKFDESVNREGIDPPSSAKPPPPPGGYAVVTRHSEALANGGTTNYTEVRQVGGASRTRSSTDPPPPSSSSHGPVTRTYTEGGAHPPLPLPPRNFQTTDDDKDGMYDSIENLKKTYDSLDNEDDNEMYESVPEDIKEEILSSSVPTRGPRYLDNAPSPSSPSPTKVPRIIATGPPDSPKGKGKKGRQRPESTSEEGEKGGHNKLSFFNRMRSSSTSAAVGGAGKKETKRHDGTHSDHAHLPALPLPPEPHQLDDEDDDDTYDSVKPSLVGNNKSATLPVKSVGLFSSRVNEPLPEVPEDSGSGSASIVVQRDRVLDKSDPNYDTVRKEEREEEEEGEEPDYDTVNRGGGSHNYAKVTSHGEGGAQPVGHDAEGYARVDPQIIERKRTNSQTKRKEEREEEEVEEEEEEDPYDRVKDLGIDDPGYSSVRELKEELANSDMPSQSEAPPTSLEAPPTQSVDEDSPVHDPELAYAIIDPSVVQRKRVASMGAKDNGSVSISNVPRADSTSPAPPLPPVGDLGIDLSEFEPPPIPDQSLNDEDLLSPPPEDEEDPYSKVGGATINDMPLDNETLGDKETVTMEIRDSVLSLGSSEGGVPVYDSLEPQAPLYDSLDPLQQQQPSPSLPPPPLSLSSPPSNEQQPTYDCLSPKEDT
ncbi:PREDICTED: uncharacterized protein LOC105312469 [Amphimedon queenslandica]|uniref:Uncharacterized protein n=1 Tax=Amphimedon queenslandica TaxID=400682 RepID=A0A1X7V1W2_AMPQE|nr:PREDICTED: uncharacterized protein LOC105312469 [Amphimedon queenslandica]|eukprot:XP_019851068.1 PREDICTED: uncharacterized protein LOC105312469 [Amphimedon queenslandica]